MFEAVRRLVNETASNEQYLLTKAKKDFEDSREKLGEVLANLEEVCNRSEANDASARSACALTRDILGVAGRLRFLGKYLDILDPSVKHDPAALLNTATEGLARAKDVYGDMRPNIVRRFQQINKNGAEQKEDAALVG